MDRPIPAPGAGAESLQRLDGGTAVFLSRGEGIGDLRFEAEGPARMEGALTLGMVRAHDEGEAALGLLCRGRV